MELDYSMKGKVKIGMIKYVENVLNNFPEKTKGTDSGKTPAGDDLFNKGQGARLLQECAEVYHTMVAKALFLCKRARQIYSPPSLYCARGSRTRTKPTGQNWSDCQST